MLMRARHQVRPRWVAEALIASERRSHLGCGAVAGGLLIWGLVGSDHDASSHDHVLDGACAAVAHDDDHVASPLTSLKRREWDE